MTRTVSRRSAPRARRLPWWIRRCVRTWARCTRRLGRGRGRAAPASWIVLEAGDACELAADAAVEAHERRCGWFDSSQDLREGLCISEHASSDPVASQLPVMAWVQLQLSGWRPGLELVQG